MAEDPLTTHARNRLGRVLRGKWTLDRIIGVGGMAAVYEATHRNGSKVAIKMLHPTLMYDTNFAHRLIQEGYVANKLNHPAAVKVMDDDADETDGAVFLVMELLDGVTLSQARRKRKKFPPVEACRMLEPVLECLGNAHALGIIHRDIKPENLFLTKDGAVRVLDFGIARVSDSSNVSATRTGMVVGSPAYMSPEQALGKMNSVGPQTDVYAVGATLFALIAGATPHAGESTQEMIVMVATQSARPILSVAPDVPPAIARVIDRALAYDRDKRFPDARVMLEEMRAALAEVEGAAPRVLPTFADDDDEGQTTVNSALGEGKPAGAAPPLPAAGANRIGTRPATGRFNVPGGAVEPVAAAAPAPPAADASRQRPMTLAPIGAPALGGPPIAPQAQVGASSGQHNPPGSSSAPGTRSAPFPAPPSPPAPSSDASGSFNMQLSSSVPPTMAMPMINPGDLGPTPGTTSGQHPGVSSGQRPGATTNMAWAAPPDLTTPEAPAPRKPKTALIAAAAVAVLGIGVGGFFAFSGGNTPAPQPPTHTARPPSPPVVQTPPAPPPQPPVVAQNDPPAEADAAPAATDAAAPAPAEDAAAVAQNTPPEPGVTAPEEPSSARDDRRRPRERAHPPAGDHTRPAGRNRNRNRNNNPLGY
jgi:serine/threonine-protein kinase